MNASCLLQAVSWQQKGLPMNNEASIKRGAAQLDALWPADTPIGKRNIGVTVGTAEPTNGMPSIAASLVLPVVKSALEKASTQSLELLTIDQLLARPAPKWLIKKALPESGLGVLYGEPGSGKTFIAIDLAVSVASGSEWQGQKVKRAGVVYIAAEGGEGLSSRFQAYQRRHGIELTGLPLALIPSTINLHKGADYAHVIDACKTMSDRVSAVGLIVIDTLSRVMPGANENAAEDMGMVIANAKTIQEATGAFVLVVHHSGKDATKGARGHSSLRAAADTELEVRRKGELRIVTVSKQRDGEDGRSFAYVLESVTIGSDEDGEAVTSCVAIPANVQDSGGKMPRAQGKWQNTILRILKGKAQDQKMKTTDVIAAVVASDEGAGKERSREVVKVAMKSLIANGALVEEHGFVWCAEPAHASERIVFHTKT
jgi:hypothetical protein